MKPSWSEVAWIAAFLAFILLYALIDKIPS